MQCSPTIKLSYLERIFETHPCDTLSCLAMSLGLTPFWASSTIRALTISGRGLPLTYTPPSWLTPPWPVKEKHIYKNTTLVCKALAVCTVKIQANPHNPPCRHLSLITNQRLIVAGVLSGKGIYKEGWYWFTANL